jgi:hypothetical protein
MDDSRTAAEMPRTRERPSRGPTPPRRPPRPRSKPRGRRRLLVGGAVLVVVIAGVAMLGSGLSESPPEDIRGTPAWAVEYYGNPERSAFKRRHIIEIEFLGRAMFVHRGASRHFLRLERLFEARAPEYAAAVALGQLDDWSYENRNVRGGDAKSSHAFGIAVDVNALANPLGTTGDMPEEVVRQWEAEGGEWGGDWSRSDPMHFETHLTPEEIRARYRPDGTPRDWYLEQLIGN